MTWLYHCLNDALVLPVTGTLGILLEVSQHVRFGCRSEATTVDQVDVTLSDTLQSIASRGRVPTVATLS